MLVLTASSRYRALRPRNAKPEMAPSARTSRYGSCERPGRPGRSTGGESRTDVICRLCPMALPCRCAGAPMVLDVLNLGDSVLKVEPLSSDEASFDLQDAIAEVE